MLLIEQQCHAASFQSNHNVFVMYFHSGMRQLQVFHIVFFHKIKQSPSTDVFMQIQFCADTSFTKFLSSCDDCQAFKRKFYLNQFICSSPAHTLFFSLFVNTQCMTATITCKLLETIYGDEALSCTRFHWMKWRQNGQ